MGIFGKLFGSKKLKITDADFGEIESFFTKGSKVGWRVKKRFLNSDIEILSIGNQDGISENQRRIILNALNNEIGIKTESEKALKEQFENAKMDFISIEKHFEPKALSVEDKGFVMSFQEKEGQNYFFNVHFENNKQVGVSIDG
jgi:predicted transcriptional regulator